MNVKYILGIALVAVVMTSCSKKNSLAYFTDIRDVPESQLPSTAHALTLSPDDELYISVRSVNPGAAAQYNVPFENAVITDDMVLTRNTRPGTRVPTYRIDANGDLDFPVLGKMHVAGMTIEQLQDKMATLISKDVEDPIVTVQLMNFQVYVAGEVLQPQAIKVTRNRFTILDAITSAGDLTMYGVRENVLVVREENGKRTYGHVDLTKSDVFTSPYFYLQPNDYIYVMPNKVREGNSTYSQDNAFKLSVISTVVSASSVIVSLIIALAVK
ncbi:MAG: polysaccharide biosynthesis/export family protein [Muribaculaceae bacterium]